MSPIPYAHRLEPKGGESVHGKASHHEGTSDALFRYDHSETARALESSDEPALCDALIAATFHDPDWRWVETECLRLAGHPSHSVQSLVASCLGHLSETHGVIDRASIESTFARLLADRAAPFADRADDARDLFERVVRRHQSHRAIAYRAIA